MSASGDLTDALLRARVQAVLANTQTRLAALHLFIRDERVHRGVSQAEAILSDERSRSARGDRQDERPGGEGVRDLRAAHEVLGAADESVHDALLLLGALAARVDEAEGADEPLQVRAQLVDVIDAGQLHDLAAVLDECQQMVALIVGEVDGRG